MKTCARCEMNDVQPPEEACVVLRLVQENPAWRFAPVPLCAGCLSAFYSVWLTGGRGDGDPVQPESSVHAF